jgi:hypothetical protein
MRWVIGILVVVVLVIIGYQYFGDRGVDVAEQPEVGVTDEAQVTEEPAEEPPAEVAEPAEPVPQETEQAAEEPAGAVEETTEEAAEATEETAEQAATATEETAEEAATAAGEQPAETAGDVATETEEAAEPAPGQLAQQAEQATEEVTEEGTEPAPGVAQEEVTEAQMAALVVGDVNVGEQVTGAVQNVEEALQGITDAQTAEAAVPQLNAVNTRLEELSTTVDQLPDDAKKVLADVLNERVAELKTLAADVTAQEGVGEVVNPALEQIIAKLEDWSQQPA